MKRRRCQWASILSIATCSVSAFIWSSSARTAPADRFYEGKTITIYVGYSVGGGYDYYARLFAQFMGQHIPGHPNIVVQNMPGAGSLKASNYIYTVAPKDGTALGVVSQTVMLEDAFKTPGIRYKANKFNYIGRMTAVLETMVSGSPKTKTIDDARKHVVIAAGTGPTSPTEGYPRLLNAFAATKFKIVAGFGGVTDALLAIERGEVDAVESSYSNLVRTKKADLDSGKLNVLVQAALERSKELPNVPTLVELGTTSKAKAALKFYTSSAAVSRSMLGPPGIPPDRVKLLRDAFVETTKDANLLALIKKSNVEFDPASGNYLQDLSEKVAATPREIIEDTAKVLQPH